MTLLGAENLVKELDDLVAIDDVDPTVKEDEHVSIIGPNGVRKSTLINLITRWLGPTSDDIHFKGESIVGLESHQVIQHSISKSFQTASIFPDFIAKENAEIAALTAERGVFGFEFLKRRNSLTDVHDVTRDALDSVELLDRTDTTTTDLPYGDKRRPEINITLTSEPDLLLMDEPTAGMSPEETESTVGLIEQVKRNHGLMFILVEHDMEIIFSILDRIVILGRGGIIAEGTPDGIRGSKAARGAYLGGVEL